MNPLSNQMLWNSVPLDILNHIYFYLPQNEEILNAISNVCRTWRLGCGPLSQKNFREKVWNLFKYQLPHDNEKLKMIMEVLRKNNLIPSIINASACCNLFSEFSTLNAIESPIEHLYYSDELYEDIKNKYNAIYCGFDDRRGRRLTPHEFGPSKSDWERINYMVFLDSPFEIKWDPKTFELCYKTKWVSEKPKEIDKNKLNLKKRVLLKKTEKKFSLFDVFSEIESNYITTTCNVRVFFLRFFFKMEYYFHNFEINIEAILDKTKNDLMIDRHESFGSALCLEMRMYVSFLSDLNLNKVNLADIDKLLQGKKITLECDSRGVIGKGENTLKISKLIYPGYCPSVVWKLKPGEWEEFISNKLKLEDVLRWSVFSSTCEKLANNLGLELYKNMRDDFG